MRIVFIGPPGAGKGTQADFIVKTYKAAHLSTGDMLRAARDAGTDVGKEADKYMSAGQLVPDKVIVGIIAQRLLGPDCQDGYLLDGFPRTIAQAEALDAMLAEKNTPLDVALELRVGEEELFERLAGRGRGDDTPEVIRRRLVAYRRQTKPLLKYYTEKNLLVTVDGLGSVEEVFGRVKGELDKIAD